MIGNFFEKLLKKNRAPEWFCIDKKKKIPEAEIKEKIRASIRSEVNVYSANPEFWDDEFTNKMTNLYYKFFNQLYNQGG